MDPHPDTPAEADLPTVLSRALGKSAETERLIWLSLPGAARDQAMERLAAIDRWHAEGDVYPAEEAANDARLSLSRFYRIAREWEYVERRSIRLLGVGAGTAGSSRTRRKTMLSKLASEHALGMVEADPEDRIPVSKHVRNLEAYLRGRGYEPPKPSTLRSVVVEARRRRDALDLVGLDIAFDICACAMRDGDGSPHRIAVCLDRGTGILLGGALADPALTAQAFADAARDALVRLGAAGSPGYPWGRMERCELVIGTDLAEARDWATGLARRFQGLGVNISDRPRRFGRYIKEHVGISIGALRMLPTLTLSGRLSELSAPPRRFTDEQARARLALEMDRHNGEVRSRLTKPASSVPARTLEFLQFVADAGVRMDRRL